MLLRAYRDGTVPFDGEGWFATGDAGELDGEGPAANKRAAFRHDNYRWRKCMAGGGRTHPPPAPGRGGGGRVQPARPRVGRARRRLRRARRPWRPARPATNLRASSANSSPLSRRRRSLSLSSLPCPKTSIAANCGAALFGSNCAERPGLAYWPAQGLLARARVRRPALGRRRRWGWPRTAPALSRCPCRTMSRIEFTWVARPATSSPKPFGAVQDGHVGLAQLAGGGARISGIFSTSIRSSTTPPEVAVASAWRRMASA